MRRTIATLVTMMLALGLLDGCGTDQVKVDNAYVAATDRVVQAFETEFQRLQTNFTPASTPTQDLKTLGALGAAVDRAVTHLRQVKAPAKIAALHARLITQVQEYSTVIQTAQKGFASDDPRAIIDARSRFSTTLATVATRITTTIDTINQRLR